MADATKHLPINGGTLLSDLKRLLSLRTKRTRTFAFGFMFAFILFTVFLAFNPSSNPSSPWFSNIFSGNSFSSSTTGSENSISASPNGSLRSQFNSIYSYLFTANSSSPSQITQNSTSVFSSPIASDTTSRSQNAAPLQPKVEKQPQVVKNQTQTIDLNDKVGVLNPNQTLSTDKVGVVRPNDTSIVSPINDKVEVLKPNQTSIGSPNGKAGVVSPNQTTIASPKLANKTTNSAPKSSPSGKNDTGSGEKGIAEKGSLLKNVTSSLVEKKQSNGSSNARVLGKQGSEDLVKGLLGCDLFDGEWVRDESYPLYKPGSCSLIDEQFGCIENGRPDKGFQQMKWKPYGCTLPRFLAILPFFFGYLFSSYLQF